MSDVDYGKYGIPDPPVNKRWEDMSKEERDLMRDYYDNTDFSKLIESEGQWIHYSIEKGLEQAARGEVKQIPDITLWPDEPEQLELDLGVVSEWDESKPYSVGQITLYFDRVITEDQWVSMIYAMDEAVTHKGWPEFILSAIIKSGTDRELFPEAYDESKESDRTGEKEV